MSIDDCEVLIVGAGPVGFLLGLMLQAKGINVKLVERQKALYPLPRAVALDHESRRLIGTLGLSKELEPFLQNICFEGGENGTNYLWRDADLKSGYPG
jgi:2-polyprenyl-6-methoxyphenol hydroxylase-like FAD-dependent oxidoreductase